MTNPGDASARARKYWDDHAPRYDREMGFWERVLFKGAREWACSRVKGDVLEVAVGTGRNLKFYPQGTRLTGIELSPEMLKIALTRRAELMPEADLRLGDAHKVEFPDASFDTIVCTFSLCSIPDSAAAVAEMKRVLRPDGELLAVEHVLSTSRIAAAIQRLLEPFARRQGDSLIRQPLEHLQREGFQIVKLERSKLGIVERIVARRN